MGWYAVTATKKQHIRDASNEYAEQNGFERCPICYSLMIIQPHKCT